MSEVVYNGQELTKAEISFVYPDQGNLKLVLDMPDGNAPMLTVYLKKFDEDAPQNAESKYVEDEDVFDKAMDRLHEFGVPKARSIELKGKKSSDVSEDDYNAWADDLMGKEIEVYYHDNSDESFDTPIASFSKLERRIKYDPMYKEEYAHFDDMLGEEIELNPVTEYRGTRFFFGFETEVDGQKKNVKVSQFVTKDGSKVSTRYSNKTIENLEKSIANFKKQGKDKEFIDGLEKQYEKQIEISRNRKLKELKEKLNLDVEALKESEEVLTIKLKNVDTHEFDGKEYLSLQGRIQ